MKLEILQVPDCPNATVLAARISELAHSRAVLRITRQVVTTEEDAERPGMTGSPTLLADGADPFARPGQKPSISCRLYHDEDGRPGSAPSLRQLRAPSSSQILVTSLDPQLQDVQLPGRVPANPAQHWADARAPVPLTGRDLIADRVRHAPQPLTHEGSLAVPGPAPKEANAVEAHADLRVMAQADQCLLRGIATAAPAPALARLAA